MPQKWDIQDLKPGMVLEATFWANPHADSPYRYRATKLDGRRAPKVVLCDDPRLRVGVPTLVRVARIDKPDRPDRGSILVEFVRTLTFKLEGVYLDPVVSKKLQILLESDLNILLDGPQGCGKTVLARAIAESLGMEFVFFNCSAVIEATDFLATLQVRASESGAPVTDFIKTDILRALEAAAANPTRRYLIFLDELNRCQESARNALMPALDSTRRVFDPTRNTFLDIPDNVQFIAAVNRGSAFTGTFGIDAAQLDRFAPIQMDYLPPQAEIDLLTQRHDDLSPKLIERLVLLADRIRHSPDLFTGLSVRATDEACIVLKHPLMDGQRDAMLPEVLKSSFCGRFSGRWDDITSDAGAVWAMIQDALNQTQRAEARASS